MGLVMNIIAFNVYIVTILEFNAQLLEISDQVREAVQKAMRSLA